MKELTLDELLLTALQRGASDLHLSAGAPPMVRMNGMLQPMGDNACTPEDTHAFLRQIGNDAVLKRVEASGSADFSYSIAGRGRFRVNAYRQRGSHSLSFRLCAEPVPDEAALALPDAVKKLARLKSGLVVLCGVPRSGKSTTAAWLINRIAAERNAHVITVEEPIETLHRHGKGLVNQKEVGLDAPDRVTAIAASLREDPDVIYVASASDGPTLALAIEAALCGTLVICGLNTPNAASTVQYITDVADGANKARALAQLAEVLAAVVAHRQVAAARRAMLFEVLLSSVAVKGILKENKLHQLERVMENSALAGMQTFDMCLARAATDKQLTPEEAEQAAADRMKFRQYMAELKE